MKSKKIVSCILAIAAFLALLVFPASATNASDLQDGDRIQFISARGYAINDQYAKTDRSTQTACLDPDNDEANEILIVHTGYLGDTLVYSFEFSQSTGRFLNVYGGADAKRGDVVKVFCTDNLYSDLACWFYLEPAGNGNVRLRSVVKPAYYIDTYGCAGGSPLRLYTLDDWSTDQLFQIVTISSSRNAIQWPLESAYVCGNDWSEYYSVKGKDHLGVDIKSSVGNTNIYAACEGTVVQTGWNSANGNTITIQHTISGKTVYSFYAHLSSVSVQKGDSVRAGDVIGQIGNTGGSSTGTHLHFAFTTQLSAGTWGYGTSFSNGQHKTSYMGYTFYDPYYVIGYGCLPD